MKKHLIETTEFLKQKFPIRNYFNPLWDGKGGGRREGKYGVSMRKENRKFSRTKNVCIEIDIRHPFPIAFPPPCSDAYSQCTLGPTPL